MTLLTLLASACFICSLVAIYHERNLTAATVVLVSVTLFVMTFGGR